MFNMPPDLTDLISPFYRVVEAEAPYAFDGRPIQLLIRDYWLDVQVHNKTDLVVHALSLIHI